MLLDLARRFDTPLYLYDEATLRADATRLLEEFAQPLGAALHFAVKANGNPHLLRILRSLGYAADAVSEGEVFLALAAGFSPAEISYTANNAALSELTAVHDRGIQVVIDSLSALSDFGLARPGAAVALRLNPGLGAGHHPHVITAGEDSKFGLLSTEWTEAKAIADRHGLEIVGLQQHIGSGILEIEPLVDAAQALLRAADHFGPLRFLDFGGGFGIPYREGQAALDLSRLRERFAPMLADCRAKRPGLAFRFEPGRYPVAACGRLLTRVTAIKARGAKDLVGIDTGFNQLLRPLVYEAYHRIELLSEGERPLWPADFAGNVCETGDFLGRDRLLPRLVVGDLLAIRDVGAYGYAMASPYNARGRPMEVLLTKDGQAMIIRRRETLADQLALVPPPGSPPEPLGFATSGCFAG